MNNEEFRYLVFGMIVFLFMIIFEILDVRIMAIFFGIVFGVWLFGTLLWVLFSITDKGRLGDEYE